MLHYIGGEVFVGFYFKWKYNTSFKCKGISSINNIITTLFQYLACRSIIPCSKSVPTSLTKKKKVYQENFYILFRIKSLFLQWIFKREKYVEIECTGSSKYGKYGKIFHLSSRSFWHKEVCNLELLWWKTTPLWLVSVRSY